MQHKHIQTWLLFYERLYDHMDGLEYKLGFQMLLDAMPIKLQAHFLDLDHAPGKLPDPSIFELF